MKSNKSLVSVAVAFGLVTASTSVTAAGFQLAEYSATGLGRAYAGEAAMADNASAQWRNPAMLTYLEGTQISVGAIYVNPNLDVEGEINGALPTSSSDFANDAVIPNFYLSHQLNDKWALGFALGTNYGMETKLGSDFAATHFGNEAMVKTVEANTNIAYKIDERISIGGGIRFVTGEGHFGATSPAQTPLPKGTPLKYMEGDDTAWGWQIGAAWQINENHRIGLSYKSEVELSLSGTAKLFDKNSLSVLNDTGSMDLELPATAELASYHQLTEDLAVHFGVNWTDWSSFKELYADLNTLPSQTVKVENWEDNYRFAMGATYQVLPELAVRTGVAYDTSAVSDQNRTITIPETDRTWLSVGATYDFTAQFSLDAGFTYIFAKDADIKESRGYPSDDIAQAIGGQFTGTTSGNVWLIGLQANYTF
ncbi:outer membrane protein transport protein [Vibrio sp. NTOU-M3]|uniref:outer membrane protein transport protein n=1 Tax=Vibrio sp. NTOU-M3 TaxID=3234954 RepID=UPI00349F07BC